MPRHGSNHTRRNAKPAKRASPQARREADEVSPLGRSPKPPKAKPPPSVDQVDEASKESFPCSDPPGFGHA
jgi:hypothetical protein